MRDADYIGKRQELDSRSCSVPWDDDLLTGLYSRRAAKRRLPKNVARFRPWSDASALLPFISLHG